MPYYILQMCSPPLFSFYLPLSQGLIIIHLVSLWTSISLNTTAKLQAYSGTILLKLGKCVGVCMHIYGKYVETTFL